MPASVTNRAAAQIANGGLDLDTTDVRMGILVGGSVVPAGAFSPDLNFVSDLLAVSGVTECSVAGYARQQVGSRAVVEDDTDDRAEVTAGTVAFGSLPAGQTMRGVFYFVEGANDGARVLLGVDDRPTFASVSLNTGVPLNGAAVSFTFPNDFVRITGTQVP